MSDAGSHRSSPFSVDSAEQDLPVPPAQWDVDAHLPQLERESLNVKQEHLVLALDYVGALLDAKGYAWAVMGGLAFFMHGNKNRNTRDVDVAIEAKPKEVIAALKDDRIFTPPLLSMAGSGCGKFYVVLGFESGGDRQIVEVDLIMAGHLGAPKNLSDVTVTKMAETAAGPRIYKVLSVQQLFRAKLHALNVRDAERDFGDLEWLCFIHIREIQEVADTMDELERMNFVSKYRKKYPEKGVAVIEALKVALRLGPEEYSG
ncbi:hypothetical protein C8A00DRAFT_34235 [Chaetomidium leptoderma]|uniref:Uncharacterized protein n=1 Tax=Chaetomidium leptoderma TaxID=669021 RepID=A0AAN6ZWN0_9PEZI|nr:hypothetical protein C8A00DRAFT_34235 [Chaetomidium leptoderma]